MTLRIVISVIVVLLLIALFVLSARAHPGGLDATACHAVSRDYTYRDGRVAKAGTRHCHPTAIAGTAALMFLPEHPLDEIELPDTVPGTHPSKRSAPTLEEPR